MARRTTGGLFFAFALNVGRASPTIHPKNGLSRRCAQINANEPCPGCAEAIHPLEGLANTGSALNIRVYLCSSAADCVF
jgi:hypothetical protein